MILSTRFKTSLASALLALGATSCASMFTGTTENVLFDSPQGGEVHIPEVGWRRVPYRRKVSKNVGVVKFRHPSGIEQEVTVDRRHQFGFTILDVLFTPYLVGLPIDLITGGHWKYPEEVTLDWSGRSRGSEGIQPDSVEEAHDTYAWMAARRQSERNARAAQEQQEKLTPVVFTGYDNN